MPPPSRPHDPFTDGPLRQNAALAPHPALRAQPSQHATTASSRSRPQHDLFAPTISRRSTSRSTPRLDDDVLADSGSEEEEEVLPPQKPARQMRRVRYGSPEGKHMKAKVKAEEDAEFVNRQPDGTYLLDDHGEVAKSHMESPELAEEARLKALDDQYAATARQYFTTGTSVGGRGSRKDEDDYEELRAPMATRLRGQVLQKLKDDQWRYEATTHPMFGG